MNKAFVVPLAAVALLVFASCCCCCTPDIDTWLRFIETPAAPIIATLEAENPDVWVVETPAPTPTILREPVGRTGAETVRLLDDTIIPERDLHDLAIRLRGLPADTERTINPSGSPDYAVGTRRVFYVSNVDTDRHFQIEAILEYKTPHVYMWVEDGARFNADDLAAAAETFEESTYATNRTFFGSEWRPGVDNDPHLTILHARDLGSSVAGYYSSADEFVRAVREDSNEMEMFYINIDNVSINSSFYNGVLAHEFQHMIHWNNDRNEETWLNEGFSELAMDLNGFDVGSSDYSFAQRPDTQLNTWPDGPASAGANYGAGYLLTSYFLDRFGADATQVLVAHDENGLLSLDEALSESGAAQTHTDFFADWVIANLLDDPSLADGRYGYEEIDPPTFLIEASYTPSEYPVTVSSTVHQYGTDYIELHSTQPLTFSFTGSTQVSLVDTSAHSGRYMWWSNRGDDSDMMLTQAFDLSTADQATLEYWTWYDIEENWDYAYVEISVDDGQTWTILEAPSSTSFNPNGNSFGWAYTGVSGDSGSAEWIKETVDLSPYVGGEVLVRFEYITDDAVNRPGFLIDDVVIPEIGYSSDFEIDDGGWVTAGFIRHANMLPQRWLIQRVLIGPETSVERFTLNEAQTGEWLISMDDRHDRAIMTISGLAPVTTEWASYSYEIVASSASD